MVPGQQQQTPLELAFLNPWAPPPDLWNQNVWGLGPWSSQSSPPGNSDVHSSLRRTGLRKGSREHSYRAGGEWGSLAVFSDVNRGRKESHVGRGECLEKDEELVNVDCYRGWIGRSLGPAHQIWHIIGWWRCGYSSFRAGHLESSFQRIVEGRQCEDVGIRSLHYFCNKLSWEGEKERDGQRPGEF